MRSSSSIISIILVICYVNNLNYGNIAPVGVLVLACVALITTDDIHVHRGLIRVETNIIRGLAVSHFFLNSTVCSFSPCPQTASIHSLLFRYKERVVWDKEDRMDLIFGSAPGLTASLLEADTGPEVDSAEPVSEVENSIKYAEESVGSGLGVEGSDGDSWSAGYDPLENSDESAQTAASSFDESYGYSTDWDDDDDAIMENSRGSRNLKIEDVIASYDSWLASKQEKEIDEETKTFVIFCDLDGVLCDFEAGVQKIFKKKKTAGTACT